MRRQYSRAIVTLPSAFALAYLSLAGAASMISVPVVAFLAAVAALAPALVVMGIWTGQGEP